MNKEFPNKIDKSALNYGCFLTKEAVDAASNIGVLVCAFPCPEAESLGECYLTGKKKDLYVVEIKNGCDENVFRNMFVELAARSPVLS